jgi:serine phosphatase RsbU (regulator of sigma subunit)
MTMRRERDPAACLEEVNRKLCACAFNGQFVTMVLAIIDTERGEVQAASAGHYPPLASEGSGGAVRPLQVDSSFILGVASDVRYVTSRFTLHPG